MIRSCPPSIEIDAVLDNPAGSAQILLGLELGLGE